MTTIRIHAGDTLWSLAAKHLGSPFRWREIWHLNRARLMRDQRYGETRRARRMEGPNWIFPGTTLALPDA